MNQLDVCTKRLDKVLADNELCRQRIAKLMGRQVLLERVADAARRMVHGPGVDHTNFRRLKDAVDALEAK